MSCAKNAEIQLYRAGSHIRSDHAVYRTDHHYVRRRRRAGTGDVHALRIFALCVVPYLWNKFTVSYYESIEETAIASFVTFLETQWQFFLQHL